MGKRTQNAQKNLSTLLRTACGLWVVAASPALLAEVPAPAPGATGNTGNAIENSAGPNRRTNGAAATQERQLNREKAERVRELARQKEEQANAIRERAGEMQQTAQETQQEAAKLAQEQAKELQEFAKFVRRKMHPASSAPVQILAAAINAAKKSGSTPQPDNATAQSLRTLAQIQDPQAPAVQAAVESLVQSASPESNASEDSLKKYAQDLAAVGEDVLEPLESSVAAIGDTMTEKPEEEQELVSAFQQQATELSKINPLLGPLFTSMQPTYLTTATNEELKETATQQKKKEASERHGESLDSDQDAESGNESREES